MSALARWFVDKADKVAGYDRTETPITQALSRQGMAIHYQAGLDQIPALFKDPAHQEEVLVVYTPALAKDHPELSFFREQGYALHKRAEVLGWATRDHFTIAVAGTHGKTTTSSMIAHILQQAGKNCTAFLGGILHNYDSNLILGGELGQETWMVVEADEYDRSFHHLSPNAVVITSMDPDHLDIYENFAEMQASYAHFVKKIAPNGSLFIKKALDLTHGIKKNQHEIREYTLFEPADFWSDELEVREHGTEFSCYRRTEKLGKFHLPMGGIHNVENATAAIALCLSLGISLEDIQRALSTFRGVERRYDILIQTPQLVYIDDYAHHPVEIAALLRSVRKAYPNFWVTAIFQPHLFSRTRDFAKGFAESLSLADEVVLTEIYPAREKPIPGVDSKLIFNNLSIDNKVLSSEEKIADDLQVPVGPWVVLSIGAGSIGRWTEAIQNQLRRLIHD